VHSKRGSRLVWFGQIWATWGGTWLQIRLTQIPELQQRFFKDFEGGLYKASIISQEPASWIHYHAALPQNRQRISTAIFQILQSSTLWLLVDWFPLYWTLFFHNSSCRGDVYHDIWTKMIMFQVRIFPERQSRLDQSWYNSAKISSVTNNYFNSWTKRCFGILLRI